LLVVSRRANIQKWLPHASRMIAGDRSGGGEQGGGGGGEPCPGWTAIHGDFHRGNLFYLPPPDLATATATTADHEDGDDDDHHDDDVEEEEAAVSRGSVAVIDWAFYGGGHCCWELLYFMQRVYATWPQPQLMTLNEARKQSS
jgi:hypothetical protein